MIKTVRLTFKVSVLIILFLLSVKTYGLSVNAEKIGNLPGVLSESSAVDFTGGSHCWSLDDSGGPVLYEVAMDGSLTKTITVANAGNRNWEDLTHDASRNYMFIGDFGNNNNDRTNLRAYRIPYPSSSSPSSLSAELISFSYPDQNCFPARWMNFDSEAFFDYKGKLYIFTKADGSAVGYTKMYSVPDSPGNYVATLVDSFYTNDRTTSADISPDGLSVVLISNTHIHLFRDFTGHDFFGGEHTQLNISGAWTQKEGVTFGGNREIYITDENTGAGNHIYYIDLSAWIPASQASTTSIEKINEISALVYPVPANQYVNVSLKNPGETKITFALYDVTGKNIFESIIENQFMPFTIRTEDFTTGIYFYKIFSEAREIQASRIIISH